MMKSAMDFSPPPPYEKGAMPKFPGVFAVLGPGIIWMALAQGSSELIWWPYVIAKYGLGFLFLLLPACVLQYPLTFEIGRYSALTGESIWKGFVRLNPFFAFFLWILMLVSFLWFGSFASAGGTALAELTQWPSGLGARGRSLVWAYLSMAVCGYALITRKKTYGMIELTMWGVAIVTFAGLFISCINPVVRSQIPTFLKAIVIMPELAHEWDRGDTDKLLTAVAWTGLGGFWTLFYSYWVLGKGIACGRYYPDRSGIAPELSTPRESADARRWIKMVLFDAGTGIVGNIATTMMMCLLAFAILHPQGILPQGWTIAVEQSRFFELTWGHAGRILFLLISAAFLADTWLSTVDAVAKVHLEMGKHYFFRDKVWNQQSAYRIMIVILIFVTGITMPMQEPETLFVITALIGFVGTVAFSYALIFLIHGHLRHSLPEPLKPGKLSKILLTIPAIIYTILAIAYIMVKYF